MSDDQPTEPLVATTPGLWARFWYYTAWRLMGLLLGGLAVRNFYSGDPEGAAVAAIFAVTYTLIIPRVMTNAFQFGYSTGMSDMIAYSVTGDHQNIRMDLHPAQAASELTNRDPGRRHAK